MKQFSDAPADGKVQKPEKPAPDFPLFAHATKRWAKKINGETKYFGPWSDPAGALAKYKEQREDLEAGRVPSPSPADANALTVKDLTNRFLTAKRHLADTREITERTFRDYHATCARLIAVFGKNRQVADLTPDDFEKLRTQMSKTMGPVALGNEIGRTRVVFNHAFNLKKGVRLIPQPVFFGDSFNKPSKKVLRIERAKRGPKMFEADELRRLIDEAGVPLKAMVLLGINAGLGQNDIANLPIGALDLDGGWLNYPRPKTGVRRRCPLWKETVAALRVVLAQRPEPTDPEDSELAFITSYGRRWVRTTKTGSPATNDEKWVNFDAISQEFRKVLTTLKINGHRGFYCLRRGFETIGGDSLDQAGVDSIMGHVRDDMASLYRQRIPDERLLKVVSVVHSWLFPSKKKPR